MTTIQNMRKKTKPLRHSSQRNHMLLPRPSLQLKVMYLLLLSCYLPSNILLLPIHGLLQFSYADSKVQIQTCKTEFSLPSINDNQLVPLIFLTGGSKKTKFQWATCNFSVCVIMKITVIFTIPLITVKP